MELSLQPAIAAFGARAKAKFAYPSASGEPEDQLRAPFEQLLADLAEVCHLPKTAVTAVGESSVSDLKTRPDYAVTVHRALVGFIELKAPGKGADPRKFKDPHDQAQWEKLHSLPNLLYTDGNAFSLWQDGELVDSVVTLIGDIESAGARFSALSASIGERAGVRGREYYFDGGHVEIAAEFVHELDAAGKQLRSVKLNDGPRKPQGQRLNAKITGLRGVSASGLQPSVFFHPSGTEGGRG